MVHPDHGVVCSVSLDFVPGCPKPARATRFASLYQAPPENFRELIGGTRSPTNAPARACAHTAAAEQCGADPEGCQQLDVLALRKPLLRLFGAQSVYASWLIVPMAASASLLPALRCA